MMKIKRGDYVRINGVLFAVTGKKQQREAEKALKAAKRVSAPIERWNGSAWTSTGTVLRA